MLRMACGLATYLLLCGVSLAEGQATDPRVSCALEATKEFIPTKLSLLRSGPLTNIDSQIALRRLEEQYCLRLTDCLIAKGSPNEDIQRSAHFAGCLGDQKPSDDE